MSTRRLIFCPGPRLGKISPFYGIPALLWDPPIPFGYTVANGAVSIGECIGPVGAVTIPSEIDGLPVTSIATNAFQGLLGLTSVTIPGSVTNIQANSFQGCSGLTNATLEFGVTSIGSDAFESCTRLASVTIPGSVANIGANAFQGCSSLTGVRISNGITSIGLYAFEKCSGLTNITIPGSLAAIGDYAFFDCTNLTAVYFTGNAPAADSTAFFVDNNVTAYYLPGTTGWSDFAGNTGLQTAIWVLPNPVITANGAQLRRSNQQFRFRHLLDDQCVRRRGSQHESRGSRLDACGNATLSPAAHPT